MKYESAAHGQWAVTNLFWTFVWPIKIVHMIIEFMCYIYELKPDCQTMEINYLLEIILITQICPTLIVHPASLPGSPSVLSTWRAGDCMPRAQASIWPCSATLWSGMAITPTRFSERADWSWIQVRIVALAFHLGTLLYMFSKVKVTNTLWTFMSGLLILLTVCRVIHLSANASKCSPNLIFITNKFSQCFADFSVIVWYSVW